MSTPRLHLHLITKCPPLDVVEKSSSKNIEFGQIYGIIEKSWFLYVFAEILSTFDFKNPLQCCFLKDL